MEILAAICVPLFIFIEPVLWVLTQTSPEWFGRDACELIQGPCVLLMPFSFALWWIPFRRIVGIGDSTFGRFVMPWVVFTISMTIIVWGRLR